MLRLDAVAASSPERRLIPQRRPEADLRATLHPVQRESTALHYDRTSEKAEFCGPRVVGPKWRCEAWSRSKGRRCTRRFTGLRCGGSLWRSGKNGSAESRPGVGRLARPLEIGPLY